MPYKELSYIDFYENIIIDIIVVVIQWHNKHIRREAYGYGSFTGKIFSLNSKKIKR